MGSTGMKLREALFYTDREGNPVMRVDVRSEDTFSGRSGHLYVSGVGRIHDTIAALTGTTEGGYRAQVRWLEARLGGEPWGGMRLDLR